MWGLYPWFAEHGDDKVHPDDLKSFVNLKPYCKVFEQVAIQEGYLVLRYGDHVYRVKDELFQEVPAPSKRIGETVQVVSQRAVVSGVVVEMHWHYNQSEPFYLLTIDGKCKSKRYWAADFL